MSRLASLCGLAALLALALTSPAHAAPVVNVDRHGVILDGYDAVAFFTDHRPVKGDAAFQSTYDGATYYFASAAHKAAFDAAPAKYAPQFGGFCAFAASRGRTAPVAIDTFSIVDGRLLLQHDAKVAQLWNADVARNLARADKYWPRIQENGGRPVALDAVDAN